LAIAEITSPDALRVATSLPGAKTGKSLSQPDGSSALTQPGRARKDGIEQARAALGKVFKVTGLTYVERLTHAKGINSVLVRLEFRQGAAHGAKFETVVDNTRAFRWKQLVVWNDDDINLCCRISDEVDGLEFDHIRDGEPEELWHRPGMVRLRERLATGQPSHARQVFPIRMLHFGA
jgi:hypothetical protein